MTPSVENFIGVYENALSDEYCDRIIAYFDMMDSAGFCRNRQQNDPNMLKTNIDDLSLFVHEESILNVHSTDLVSDFNKVLWDVCYRQYSEKFSVLRTSGEHNSHGFKIQKTAVGEGYHVWHYESCDLPTARRLLVWTLYLNDVEEGGETEFLYYPRRVKPKKGTLLLWPAGFTHTHRGNPPISNTKYIVTGWIEF